MPDINDPLRATPLAETQLVTFQLPDETKKFFDEGIKRVTDLRNAYNASKRSYDELLVVVFEGSQMEFNFILEEKQTH